MARIRTIKPEFFTSPDTASVSHAARLLYVAMWCLADDYGRGEMNMLQLRAFAFPEEDQWLDYELQRQSKEFQCLCKEVVDGFGIDVYRHRGRTFYSIPSWDDHQKPQRRANPKFPAPDDPDSTPDQRFSSNEGTSVSLQGTSVSPQGKTPLGTGKGNREREQEYISSEPSSDSSARRSDARPSEYPPAFEDWWKTYPRRRNASKKGAAKQWREATKTIDAEELLRLTAVYADNPGVDDARYIPHPYKWLKDRRWEAIEETDNPATPHSRFTPEALAQRAFGESSRPDIIDAEVLPWQLEA